MRKLKKYLPKRIRSATFIELITSLVLCQLIGGLIASWRHKSPADGADVGLFCWGAFFSIWAFLLPVQENFQLTSLPLDEANRMLRWGFGKHNGKWFVRIDLWSVGFRITRKPL